MKKRQAVLLDTSFFIRFLNENDPLFENADGYFRYFIQSGIDMVISTISIAEYCTGGSINQLPLRNLQILSFNVSHGQKAGEFCRIAFQARKDRSLEVPDRKLIPNDTKLFAQADTEPAIDYYLSADTESLKVYNAIKPIGHPRFQFIDLREAHHGVFGVLDLK